MIDFIAIDAVRASIHPTVVGGCVVHLFKEKTKFYKKQRTFTTDKFDRIKFVCGECVLEIQ